MTPRSLALLRPVLRAALGSLAALALLAALAGAVRVAPWVLDPALPLSVALVFAQSVAAYLGEIALWVALPAGLALALAARCERGEIAVFALLGEAPGRTVVRLWPLLVAWAMVLGAVSFAAGTTARAPGRVLGSLLAEGEAACGASLEPSSQAVPFLGASWICEPGEPPWLVGRSPVGGIAYRARGARVSGDVSAITLHNARLLREGIELRAGVVRVSGLRPLASAAILAPALRALTVIACAIGSALVLAFALLARSVPPRPTAPALALAAGLAGPVAGLLALSAAQQKPALGIALALAASVALPALVLSLQARWQARAGAGP